MKSRIICLCLCALAVGISMLMTVNLINKDEYIPPENSPVNKPVEETLKPDVKPDKNGEIVLERDSIASFMDKMENYIEALAYGDEKNFDDADYYIHNLERVSEYLASTEVGDKPGSEYVALIGAGIKEAKNGYVSDKDFSEKVSALLVNLDSAVSKLSDSRNGMYPELDTSAGGKTTLALLSLYENAINPADANTFTITVGGGALMGDRLGTSEELKFANQVKSHKFTYPLYAISSVIASDDATFIALEAPLTSSVDSVGSTNPAKGKPEYAERLVGIEAVSIASNKVLDYGEVGLNETAKALKDNGISYSVNNNAESLTSDFGKVVYITFDITDTPVTDAQKEQNKAYVKDAVTREREGGADLVIVLIRWNTRQRKEDSLSADYLGTVISEYEPHFDAYNKEIARAAIGDGVSGADLVVGYGSRVSQGIESYNNKLIVYNTGDLTCSEQLDPLMKNTDYAFLFRQTFVKDGAGVKSLSYRIIPIVNTSAEEPYLPRIVFDERADEIIEKLIYESRYFGNAIKSFNYISIKK